MGKLIDLTGQKFGRLTVIERAENGKRGHYMFLCRCECGVEKVIRKSHLLSGAIVSCGCLKREINITHGKTHSRLYHTWDAMIRRCENVNNPYYKNYGGRGISVCKEWRFDFQAFYEWAIHNGYDDNLTIERVDFDGNYEASNCKWITISEQQRNKRTNYAITLNGKTQCAMAWAEELGIKYTTLLGRLKLGWSTEKALTTPVRGSIL